MSLDLENVYDRLYEYCKNEEFAGHDPFDGLNSPLIQSTPFRKLAPARFAWLQLVKRLPVNLRGMLRIPKGTNPQGSALFALGELCRFGATQHQRHAPNAG